jgi:hypothetical protein
MWCIPEKPSAEFVYHMEDVLEVYHRPYDPQLQRDNQDDGGPSMRMRGQARFL